MVGIRRKLYSQVYRRSERNDLYSLVDNLISLLYLNDNPYISKDDVVSALKRIDAIEVKASDE